MTSGDRSLPGRAPATVSLYHPSTIETLDHGAGWHVAGAVSDRKRACKRAETLYFRKIIR